METNATNMSVEETLGQLMTHLSECSQLVLALGKKTEFEQEELLKLRNDLMLARSKALNLAEVYAEMLQPSNSLKLTST